MSAGDNHFWTFEQALSFYSFYTKALDWKSLDLFSLEVVMMNHINPIFHL